ncbi:type III secretion system chaperone [Desulfovibrio sp. OttesenSCG-928-G11]|nr:type III secretion system chaperone [Desulfovibrio sp. OttesenSCG-928-G11]
MSQSDIQRVLREFAQQWNTGPLELDEEASCLLSLDQSLLITLSWQEKADFLLAYAPVGSYDAKEDNRQLFQALLEANGAGSSGPVLGIEPSCGLVLLSGRLSGFGLDVESLAHFLEEFAEQAAAWSKNIAALHAEKQKRASATQAPLPREIRV